jgi:quercetin dioxygenase-like cupin family protein
MSLPPPTAAIVRGADEGEDLWVIGGLYSYKGRAHETGAYLACEVRAPDGFAIPVHYHEDEEEGFYVARGEVTVFLGDQEHRLAAGAFALAPRGVEHAFRFESADAVLLLLLSPGPKHEGLFREMGEPASEHRIPPPPSEPPDAEALAAIAARHGTRIVGPPRVR